VKVRLERIQGISTVVEFELEREEIESLQRPRVVFIFPSFAVDPSESVV
jgi:hypothetical protein